MSSESAMAAANGIEPCPMCGSADVRWHRRRPTDFVLTWMRWWVEFFAGLLSAQSRATRRSEIARDNVYFDNYDEFTYGTGQTRMDVSGEIREANTGHKTPKRFWNALRANGNVTSSGTIFPLRLCGEPMIFTLSPCRRRDSPHTLDAAKDVPLGEQVYLSTCESEGVIG